MSTRVVVAGGDARDAWLCRFLEDQGYEVKSFGFHVEGVRPFCPKDAPLNIFIGPMTGIDAQGRMETVDGEVVLSSDILHSMSEGAVVAAGLIASPIKERAKSLGIKTIEYRNQTTFMWLNAVPTAEGAIKSAIGRSGFTLYHRPIAVLGFGRVGSILALRLQAYGAMPEIFDRAVEKRAMASAMGFPVHSLDPKWCPPVDGVFNTIPAPVLTRQWAEATDPVWIIDLASKPGGLHPSIADDAAILSRYESYLGVPGHIAPRRAAEIIWETLASILQDQSGRVMRTQRGSLS
ncbi:MAG: hydroxyacid dehydrogenase [Firmicutes bacterium]|uniref:Hydroxyacid dehydrogenase n=1 Tax=Sulfobacillus benefaciens TaxID=453960 RepID=A0A2T2XB58_9FIRM|nr:hydroxyacid dehydrogenase [Bacillota bacterium]PSR31687.1 MAG: hydroxyacid dehydrogenase [Sulfobacillus benefaciens]